MVQLIAARSRPMVQRHRLNTGTIEKPLDSRFNGNVEIDPSGVDKQRNLPGRDGAEENRAAVSPAAVDQGTRLGAQRSSPQSSHRTTWVSSKRASITWRPRDRSGHRARYPEPAR